MSINEANAKLPHSIIDQSLDPVQDYRTKMGVVNFHYSYDHYFEATTYMMMLIDEFNVWLKEDIGKMKLPTDNRSGFQIPNMLPEKEVRTMKQIWWGGDPARNIEPIYLYQKRDSRKQIIVQKVVYSMPARLNNYESIWQMPALKHLAPKSSTKDDTDQRVLLQEAVPVDMAWSGVSPQQLADIVKFKNTYPEGEEPIFESDEDVLWSDSNTMEVSRDFFHKIIRIELLEFDIPRHIVWNCMKKCLRSFKYCLHLRQLMRQGGSQTDDSEYIAM
jgi:hypothetical protein